MKVLLFHGKGFISWLIRVQTRGKYSHAAIMLPDGTIIEAWQGKGVQKLEDGLKSSLGVDAFAINAPLIRLDEIQKFLEAVLADNDGYDYLGVFRFITRRPDKKNNKWFCSELVFEALRAGGVDLFARTEAWEVSPAMLARSPLLTETEVHAQYE